MTSNYHVRGVRIAAAMPAAEAVEALLALLLEADQRGPIKEVTERVVHVPDPQAAAQVASAKASVEESRQQMAKLVAENTKLRARLHNLEHVVIDIGKADPKMFSVLCKPSKSLIESQKANLIEDLKTHMPRYQPEVNDEWLTVLLMGWSPITFWSTIAQQPKHHGVYYRITGWDRLAKRVRDRVFKIQVEIKDRQTGQTVIDLEANPGEQPCQRPVQN